MAAPRRPSAPPAADKGPGAPQQASNRPPQGQQATAQQKGNPPAAGGKSGGPMAGGSTSSGSGPSGPPPGPGGGKGPAPGSGPEPNEPPQELTIGPSPDLEKAYQFLAQYVQNGMPPGVLPQGMLTSPDGSDVPSIPQLPTTTVGDIKTFPKYSLATGSPGSPNLPTGMLPPTPMVGEPNLIAGLPKSQVQINQMRI